MEKEGQKETEQAKEGADKAAEEKKDTGKEELKTEEPKKEEPKKEEAKAEEKPAEKAKPAAEKPTACAKCGKNLGKKSWYYRNGKYYCNKRCWKLSKEKS